jgi:hypothetical protein
MATIWDNIPRALDDTQTIGEAINEAINDHNADNTAHLGEDESLQSHRAAEIIDHLAESVVNDKLATNSRRYVAIVDPASESDFDTVESALTYAASRGGGDIYITRGLHEVSSNLSVPVTVSLQGDGINESIIVSNNTTKRTLQWDTGIVGVQRDFYGVTTVDGSDIVTYTSAQATPTNLTVGLVLGIPYGTAWYEITEVIDATHLRVDRAISGTRTSFTANGYLAMHFTNGSRQATFTDAYDPSFLQIYAGSTYNAVTTVYGGDVVNVSRDGTLETLKPFTGTTGTYGVTFAFSKQFTTYIDGISFGDDTRGVAVSFLEDNSSFEITNCFFSKASIGSGFYGTDVAPGIIQNTILQASTADYLADVYSCSLINCSVYATANYSKGFNGTSQLTLRDTIFYSNGYNNNYWITGSFSNIMIDNCVLQEHGSVTLSGSGSTTTTTTRYITNTAIEMSTSATMTISGHQYILTNNRLRKSSGAPLAFNGSSARCIYASTIHTVAPTNAGTGNLIVNNVVG